MVVGIIDNDVSCFETKKRVPYKIVFECVELIKKCERIKKQQDRKKRTSGNNII